MYSVVCCVVDGAKTTVSADGERGLATQSAADASRSPAALIADSTITFSEANSFPGYVNVQTHYYILNSTHVHSFNLTGQLINNGK